MPPGLVKRVIGFEETGLPPWARIRLEEIDRDLAEMRTMDEPPTSLIKALEDERKMIVDSRST